MKYFIKSGNELGVCEAELQPLKSVLVTELNGYFIKPIFDNDENPTSVIEGNTVEEINAKKSSVLLKTVQSIYDSLMISSLGRAMNKVGYSETSLRNLSEEYLGKFDLAIEIINGLTITNESLLVQITEECERDFAGSLLNAELTLYGIETTGTRIVKFAKLIQFKYNYGNSVLKLLYAYCSSFRTTCITDIENLDFDKCQQRIDLSPTITNETSIEDIGIKHEQFKNL